MKIRFDGRVALVTGSSRGIGAAIARLLAACGARMVINYRINEAAAAELARSIRDAGGEAMTVQADVTRGEDVREMANRVVAAWGGVDILVNNAITGVPWKPFWEHPYAAYLDQFEQSFKSAYLTTTAFSPGMKDRRWGRIINISTVCWIENEATQSAYNVGKGALYSFSRTIARELGPFNVTVNIVAPGWMVTEKVDPNSEASRRYAERVPLRRHGGAEEIANAVVFFASPLGDFVTGAFLPVSGGLHLW